MAWDEEECAKYMAMRMAHSGHSFLRRTFCDDMNRFSIDVIFKGKFGDLIQVTLGSRLLDDTLSYSFAPSCPGKTCMLIH
nr:hypothetical protein [Tanacetum cinerariifolium]